MLQYWMMVNSENKLIFKQYFATLYDGKFRK
jgi:hypothetical protein